MPTEMTPELQAMYAAYMADPNHENGIPVDLYHYASAHPELGIDRSGNGLATTDPMYNLYNPNPGQTPGVDWWFGDDRNNAMLDPNFDPSTTQLGQNAGQLSGTPQTGLDAIFGNPAPSTELSPQSTGNLGVGGFGAAFGGVPAPSGSAANTPANVQQLGGGTPAPAATTPAPTPTTPAPTTPAAPAAPQYDFSNILSQYGIGSQQLTGQIMPILQQILAQMNQGYNPQTMSALRSQATSQIPKQYEQAAQQLRLNLLRHGAIGAGDLPAAGGDILRSFAPLDQARNEAVAGAQRSTILGNQAEIARNQERGSQAIGQVLQAQGLSNQILSAGIDYMKATSLADFDAATRIKLAQMGIDSNEKLAALQSQTQLTLGGMDAATKLALGNLDSETTKWVAGLSSETQKALAQLSSTTAINMNNLDNATRLKIADIENAPGSLKSILLASVVGSALSGGANGQGGLSGLVNKGIDGLISIFKGGSSTTALKDVVAGAVPLIPLSATGAATAVVPAVAPVGGGSFGAGLTSLMTNPITIGVGAAIAGTIMWLKSQAHWEANSWVQGYQNKFDTQVADINKQFWDLASSGKLTKESGQQMMTAVKGMMDTYESQRQKFEGQGSDEKKVAGQALATFNYWYGANGSTFLGKMQDAIGQLA